MNTIVVGTDQSPQATVAVQKAAEMATLYGAALHLVTAAPTITFAGMAPGADYMVYDSFEEAERALAVMAESLPPTLQVSTAVIRSDPATALCDEAARLDASVIVVGNKRVQGIGRILGSVAAGVAKSAPCDVFIAHTYG